MGGFNFKEFGQMSNDFSNKHNLSFGMAYVIAGLFIVEFANEDEELGYTINSEASFCDTRKIFDDITRDVIEKFRLSE